MGWTAPDSAERETRCPAERGQAQSGWFKIIGVTDQVRLAGGLRCREIHACVQALFYGAP